MDSFAEFRAGGAKAMLLDARLLESDRTAAVYLGLTGGIGSGKTTVAQTWAEAGATVISADELAREVVEPGSPGLDALVETFGARILDRDGGLDRSALGQIVFSSPDTRKTVEAITHPLIGQRAAQIRDSAPSRVVVYDVPLLVETDMSAQFDVVAVVDAPVSTRLLRLESRGMTQTEAQRRIAVQATQEQREAVADIWLENSGAPKDLATVARAAYEAWL